MFDSDLPELFTNSWIFPWIFPAPLHSKFGRFVVLFFAYLDFFSNIKRVGNSYPANIEGKVAEGVDRYHNHQHLDHLQHTGNIILLLFFRAGNSLIGFLRESLVFCPKLSEWAIRSQKWPIHSFPYFWWANDSLVCSFLVSDFLTIAHFLWAMWANESLMVAHFWWATWAIRSYRSLLVSDLRDSLTSLRGNKLLWANRSHR